MSKKGKRIGLPAGADTNEIIRAIEQHLLENYTYTIMPDGPQGLLLIQNDDLVYKIRLADNLLTLRMRFETPMTPEKWETLNIADITDPHEFDKFFDELT